MTQKPTSRYSFPFADAVTGKPASKPKACAVSATSAIKTSYLHDIVNDTKSRAFCGPTAVAAITGEPISRVRDCYRLVRYGSGWVNRRRAPPIMGTRLVETEKVLRLLGFAVSWQKVADAPTLAAYLDNRTGMQRTYPCVVRVTGHLVAVSGWLFCDTFSKGQVVDADTAPGRRKRVTDVLVITGRIPPAPHIPTKAAPVRAVGSLAGLGFVTDMSATSR
ncbi:hypothetical protein ACWGPT_16785 [Pseudorhizobium sp. NPDC055634]